MAKSVRAPKAQKAAKPPRGSRANAVAERIQGNFADAYRGQSRDFYMLFGVIIALVAFGLIMVLSASYVTQLSQGNPWFSTIGKQLVFVILGVAAMTFSIIVGPRFFERVFPVAYVVMLVIQLSVSVIGKEVNGNKNWIQILPGVSFQPSEVFKVILPLALAFVISRNYTELDNRRTWVQAAFALMIPVGIIMFQKDLGTVLVIVAQYLGLALLAGIPTRLARNVALVSIPLLGILLSLSSSRLPRIMAWLFPSPANYETYNWQQQHGLWALAAGGFGGVGLGAGKMKWSWIPEVDNDFIFAVIGEELGIMGCLVVILLFVVMIFTLIRIAQNTEAIFSRYFVFGVATWIAAQAFINIAVVIRLLPVLGVPLPLISQGGTSMIAVLTALGIVLGIERQNHLGGQGISSNPRAAKLPTNLPARSRTR